MATRTAKLILVLLLGLGSAPARADDTALGFAEDEALLRAYLADPVRQAGLLRADAELDVRILNVAAHPDDEDGATLTWLRHEFGYRTHILYTTRGEGGQNETGPELGDALGVIRSRECQRGAQGYCATISFLNALDFGFSKHASEALERWGAEEMLRRLLDELRRIDADIILTHHTPDRGHGHHRATSGLLREACRQLSRTGDEAAPKVLLELSDAASNASVATDPGGRAAGLPWSYAAWAHVALRRHASQGMALSPRPADAPRKYYEPIDGVGDAGAIQRWSREPEPFSPASLATLVPLVEDRDAAVLRARATRIQERRWLRIQTPAFLGRGDMGELTISGPASNELAAVALVGEAAAGAGVELLPGARTGAEGEPWTLLLRASGATSYPWERHVRDHRGAVDSLRLALRFEDGSTSVHAVAAPALVGPGELELPPSLPPIVPNARVEIPMLWRGTDPPPEPRIFEGEGLTATATPWLPGSGEIPGLPVFGSFLTVTIDSSPPDSVQLRILAPGVRVERALPVLRLALPPDLRIGFVEGVDGSLGDALSAVGVDLTRLDETALAGGELSVFDAIVLDIRAYLVRGDLTAHNDRLLEYARAGGHLVVQYQKTYEWNAGGDSPWPPFALTLGHDRVVDETAPVMRLDEQHSFWHWPHRLTAQDWEGWVQERGLYFPARWSSEYRAVLRLGDAGEGPLDGGVLTARLGRGAYTYSSLVWYRQLRVAHPGAFRAFVNLVCWPMAPDNAVRP